MAYTTINKSTDYFNTLIYTGNGSSPRNITGVGFQPDWLWIKNRDAAQSNFLFDAVRGVSKAIFSDSSAAESTQSQTQTAFLSDGFTVGNDVASNGNGNGIVSWNWKANGQGSSNTDGSINTTYTSVNTTAGFSISSYTGNGSAGATVGHGLGAVPKMMIIKQTSSNGGSENWAVYHHKIGNTDALYLSTTNSVVGSNYFWNNTTPSSTLFTLGSGDHVNNNTVSYIAYCFAEKTGYSKFGSYTGNGNADGAFIYLGFKPAFVMIKRTDGADTWTMYDNKRTGFNVDNNPLFANAVTTESTDDDLDILSNGFKIRRNSGRINTSGGNFIYMAFAAAPLVGTNNIPANAR